MWEKERPLLKKRDYSSSKHLHSTPPMSERRLRLLSGKSTITSAGKFSTPIPTKLNYLSIESAWRKRSTYQNKIPLTLAVPDDNNLFPPSLLENRKQNAIILHLYIL